MLPFDRVVLIFNPKSTGQAQKQAEDLRRDLGQRVPMLAADLVPTEHAGHATELSRTPAGAGSPLVVSVSGDGGYNEVVNGVMQAGNDRAASAVLAAGTPTTTGAPRGNCRLRRRSLRAPSAALTCSASPQAPGRRCRPIRPLVHRAGVDPRGRGRPREGGQGLIA